MTGPLRVVGVGFHHMHSGVPLQTAIGHPKTGVVLANMAAHLRSGHPLDSALTAATFRIGHAIVEAAAGHRVGPNNANGFGQ